MEIFLEGADQDLKAFVQDLKTQPPPAARLPRSRSQARGTGRASREFTIRESQRREPPTVRISPDLPVCEDCLQELFDPADRRYRYPYINCTNCGPRYTVIQRLPYDRPNTTMERWPLDEYLRARVSRSREPPLSRAAGGLPGVRAQLLFASRRGRSCADDEAIRSQSRGVLSRRARSSR